MKIFVTTADRKAYIFPSIHEALNFAKSNDLSYVMIDNENGSYMRGDFTLPFMAVDFLNQMQDFNFSPTVQ